MDRLLLFYRKEKKPTTSAGGVSLYVHIKGNSLIIDFIKISL